MFHLELSLRLGRERPQEAAVDEEEPPGGTSGSAQVEATYDYTERRFGTGFCLPPE